MVENLAYDVALSIRKAQVFGLSIRESSPGVFDTGYGVHFDTSSNNSYIFFKDTNKNKKYDDSSEVLETFSIGKGNTIAQFCTTLFTGVEKCSPSGITYLDIIFERPNPDAIIKTNLTGDTYASAQITVSSPEGVEWNIETITTGQISIQE